MTHYSQDTASESNYNSPFYMLGESQMGSPLEHSNNKATIQKPKRNKSAFLLFSSEARAMLKVTGEGKLNSNEMMSKLADLWKDLPQSERKIYDDKARKDKERYLRELDNFYRENPSELIQNKTKRNHTKKPCSAYALFLKDAKVEIKKENPKLLMAEILKVVAERWKNLDEETKSKYQEKAQKEKAKYETTAKDKASNDDEMEEYQVNSKKAKHLGRIRKQIKMAASSPETCNLDLQTPQDPVFESHKLPQEDLESKGTVETTNYETAANNYVLPLSFYCDQKFELAPTPDLYQLTNPLLSIPRSIFESSMNFKQASKEDNGVNDLIKIEEKLLKTSSELIFELTNYAGNKSNEENNSLLKMSYPTLNPNASAYNNNCKNFDTKENTAPQSTRQKALNDLLVNALNMNS